MTDTPRTEAGRALVERIFSAPFARTSVAEDIAAVEREAVTQVRAALEELAADLVQDHRGIPYDVIDRIDGIVETAA